MALPQPANQMTEAEYLAFELESKFKHEYVDGEVLAMTGASENHNLIAINIVTGIKNQLRGKPYEIYHAAMRVKIESAGIYTYPDISVVCGVAQFAAGIFDSLINPALIIEILSPSTEAYDRGRKFQNYRQLDSLTEYVLVTQDAPRIERFHRQSDDLWLLTDNMGMASQLELTSIGCTLSLEDIYEQVTFPEEKPAEPDETHPGQT